MVKGYWFFVIIADFHCHFSEMPQLDIYNALDIWRWQEPNICLLMFLLFFADFHYLELFFFSTVCKGQKGPTLRYEGVRNMVKVSWFFKTFYLGFSFLCLVIIVCKGQKGPQLNIWRCKVQDIWGGSGKLIFYYISNHSIFSYQTLLMKKVFISLENVSSHFLINYLFI